ncbi:Flp pilus assembly protein CpaB [Novosphingobium clariflavum]|uniref:Flp pilus assembly protein CpaB n=1 Tax=Novosphingobium clariflavum TaxID=2029884 RepID=A0ABV6SC96_9SPHN|nr:Flp pilus assembly protein CpaB [Novosphingobium clariflavum]
MRLGSKAKLTIGIGLVAAAGFAALGLREMGKAGRDVADLAARAAVRPSTPVAPLLVATTRPIRTGETIRADMIRNAKADPMRFPTAVSGAEILGKVATRDIPGNSLIPREAIGQETKLAIRVPMGMRAISIDTTAEIAVAGLVRPGDRVDVQVVYPGEDAITGARGMGRSEARTLLQMVPVLAVGDVVVGTAVQGGTVASAVGQGGAEVSAPPPPPARTVTLALSPEQVSRLSLAKSTGALYLSLRNPDDTAQVALAADDGPRPLIRAVPRDLAPMQRAAPRPPAPRPVKAPAPRGHAIELVVGGNSATIYSGSASQ